MKINQNEKFIRQPALRLFAAELAESKQTIIEHIDGRDFDSRYQLTPTGVKVKRVLMMGALVEVDNVGTSGEYLRGRIVDPTGAFTVYAGQYQPEALLSLSNLTIPCFVAVVGKTNAYRPDEETTIVSIRPETIVEIDAKTRDHWIKETVAKTLERVGRSQIPEAEKEKYRQMCKDALTKLVYTTQETGVHETPEIPHQEENIHERLTIEQPIVKGKQPDGSELKEEKPAPSLPASASEKHTEHESVTSTDALSIREHEDEEHKDKILISKESKRNKPVKRLAKKKKIERGSANNNQKTLFTDAPGQE